MTQIERSSYCSSGITGAVLICAVSTCINAEMIVCRLWKVNCTYTAIRNLTSDKGFLLFTTVTRDLISDKIVKHKLLFWWCYHLIQLQRWNLEHAWQCFIWVIIGYFASILSIRNCGLVLYGTTSTFSKISMLVPIPFTRGFQKRFDPRHAGEILLFAYSKTNALIYKGTDQRLIFATYSAIPIFFITHKFQNLSHLLWLYNPICVGPGR